MTSFIYNGTVIHKRFKPKMHFFKYDVFSLLIDLAELKILDKKIKFFSYNRFNLISFFEKDHGDRDGSSLEDWVKRNLDQNNIVYKNIKIKLLCYPRILGYVFNPLSVFYIYDEEENLISILYEVKNTFGEQHTYIFKTKNNDNLLQHNCASVLPPVFQVLEEPLVWYEAPLVVKPENNIYILQCKLLSVLSCL